MKGIEEECCYFANLSNLKTNIRKSAIKILKQGIEQEISNFLKENCINIKDITNR